MKVEFCLAGFIAVPSAAETFTQNWYGRKWVKTRYQMTLRKAQGFQKRADYRSKKEVQGLAEIYRKTPATLAAGELKAEIDSVTR